MCGTMNRLEEMDQERLRRLRAYIYPTPMESRLRSIVLWCYDIDEQHPKGRGRLIETFGDIVCHFHDRLVERRLRRG